MLDRLPSLDVLANPHLLVVGEEWRHDAVRAVLGQLFHAGANVVYVGHAGATTEGSGWVVDLRRADLTDALGISTEAYGRLKSLLLATGGDDGPAAAAALDDHAAGEAVRVRTPLPISGVIMVAVVLPSDHERAASVIDDMGHHAEDLGLPLPRIQLRRELITPTEAREQLQERSISPDALTVAMPVRTSAEGAADWRPYDAQGVRPRLVEADILGAIEVAEVKMLANPKHAKTDPAVIRSIAEDLIRGEPWRVAFQVAAQATAGASGMQRMRSVLDVIALRPAAEPAVQRLRTMLAGNTRLPSWWSQPMFIAHDGTGSSDVRVAVTLESVLDHATRPELLGNSKVVVIDSQRIASTICREALNRILLQGRKHGMHAIVFANDPSELGPVLSAMPNWVVHRASGTCIGAAIPPDGVAGWFRSGASPNAPMSKWWQPTDVTDGERILTGILPTGGNAAQEPT